MGQFILLIESATETCSAALADGNTLIAQKVCHIGRSHDTVLAPLTDGILKENGLKASDLAAVAVSEGPGSYMGLRIGVALAKGIAYAAKTNLIGINTLAVIARCACESCAKEFRHIVPMIDAGRMEVYTAVFDGNCSQLEKTEAKILTPESFRNLTEEGPVLFAGNGAPKFGKLLEDTYGSLPDNATIINQTPLASGLRIDAAKALEEGRFADLAYFQPFYLKEFIPGKQKKLL